MRHRLMVLGCLFLVYGLAQKSLFAQEINPISLSWLDGAAPAMKTGVSWGVPLPQGKLAPASSFTLKNEAGDPLPLQSWPMAYWPDGTLKWIGLSTVAGPNAGNILKLETTTTKNGNTAAASLTVSENKDNIRIDTGILQCEIPRNGKRLINYMHLNSKPIAGGGRLICIMQNGPDQAVGAQPARDRFLGEIEAVTVEQDGPVRAVVKIEGKHVAEAGERRWLPFVVRLYFHAGLQSVRMVHTIIYDGDQNQDFIRGLGISFNIPMDEQFYNRHVRFSGENGGLWDEPSQPMKGRRWFGDPAERLYAKQLTGERLDEPQNLSEKQRFQVKHLAAWNDFKLSQLSADGFQIKKAGQR